MRFDDAWALSEPTLIGTNPLPVEDNHGPPPICDNNVRRVLAFYGSLGRHYRVARTSKPYDVSSWDDLGAIDGVPKGTYSLPFAHGGVYVFYRAATGWDDETYLSAQYGAA